MLTRRERIKLYLNSTYGKGVYITLDCRDNNHAACVVCNCECHFKEIEFEMLLATPFSKRYTDSKEYTPRHMKGSAMNNPSVRLSLMALAVVFISAAIVAGVVWLY